MTTSITPASVVELLPTFSADLMTKLQDEHKDLHTVIATALKDISDFKGIEEKNRSWTVGLAGVAASVVSGALVIAMYAALVLGIVYTAPAYLIGAAAAALVLALAGACDLFTGGILATPLATQPQRTLEEEGEEPSSANDIEKKPSDFNGRAGWQKALFSWFGVLSYQAAALANARIGERSKRVEEAQKELDGFQKEFVDKGNLDLVAQVVTDLENGDEAEKKFAAELKPLLNRLTEALKTTEAA